MTSLDPVHDAAHDWRHAPPPPHPPCPPWTRLLRPLVVLLVAGLVLAAVALRVASAGHRRQARADDADARAEQATSAGLREALADADARARRVEALEAWLAAHPPLQPLVIAALGPLAGPGITVAGLHVVPARQPGGLRLELEFQATPTSTRQVFASLPASLESAGWRMVPTRQDHDPSTHAAVLHAELALLETGRTTP